MEIIKTAKLVDSKGNTHQFSLVREVGGYTFTWDNKEVDWSFTVHGYNRALWHFNYICEDVLEINHMNSWVNG